jgi:hypothetical protein
MHLNSMETRLLPVAVLLVVGLALVPAAVLRGAECLGLAATNGAPVSNTSTNALRLWIDVPTNAVRSDLWCRADTGGTNDWQPSGMGNVLATSSTWRTTVEVETGYFHGRHGGWFQEVGVGLERELNPVFSVGLGVSVGRANLR